MRIDLVRFEQILCFSKIEGSIIPLLSYEFHKNCFDLWLTVYIMSMTNAEKLLEYT